MNIKCAKCGRTDIQMVSNPENTIPMYRCNQCGHKANLFPQMGNANKKVEETE